MDEKQLPGVVQVVYSTYIQHRASSVGREALVHLIPVLTPEYLLPSQWVPGIGVNDFRGSTKAIGYSVTVWPSK